MHQFSKVEMFVLSTPEQSDALHEELISLEEEMFAELGLHFKCARPWPYPHHFRLSPNGRASPSLSLPSSG